MLGIEMEKISSLIPFSSPGFVCHILSFFQSLEKIISQVIFKQ
jgi:hypothetical protein